MKTVLNESSVLKYGSLEDVIYPDMTVDVYEPKTGSDPDVIVVSFAFLSEDGANDARDFFEKGVYEFIDVEAAPNPDPDGRWLVFIEFERSDSFWDNLRLLVKDANRLAGKKVDWKVKTYFTKKILDLESLPNYVITDKLDYMIQKYKRNKRKVEYNLNNFFNSGVNEVFINEDVPCVKINGEDYLLVEDAPVVIDSEKAEKAKEGNLFLFENDKLCLILEKL